MRLLFHALGTTFLISTLGQVAPASAQERAPVFGGFSASIAFVDTHRDDLLDVPGYHLTAYVGRRFTPHVAGLAQITFTTISHQTVFFGYPLSTCALPGCASFPDLNAITALTLAPGLQFYRATSEQKLAFTMAPGAVWLLSHPSATRAIAPMIGGRLEYGWLLGSGPRFGISLEGQWWATDGALPRWTVPVGVAVEFH